MMAWDGPGSMEAVTTLATPRFMGDHSVARATIDAVLERTVDPSNVEDANTLASFLARSGAGSASGDGSSAAFALPSSVVRPGWKPRASNLSAGFADGPGDPSGLSVAELRAWGLVTRASALLRPEDVSVEWK